MEESFLLKFLIVKTCSAPLLERRAILIKVNQSELQQLIQITVEWQYDKSQEDALDLIKSSLCRETVLACFDPQKELNIQ